MQEINSNYQMAGRRTEQRKAWAFFFASERSFCAARNPDLRSKENLI
jgi:hypothetical protein